MGLFGDTCSYPASILLLLVIAVYLLLKRRYTYWERRRIPFLKPRMLFGNLETPFTRKTAPAVELKMFYDELKSRGVRHGGIYSFLSPVYIPIDLQYVKSVLAQDFQYFMERGRYYNEKDDPLSAHLFHIGGIKWRNLRTKFTPTFTSGKLKGMFSNLLECGDSLMAAINSSCQSNESIEMKDFANKFTVEVIGSCVFGVKYNCFTSTDAEFVKCGTLILSSSLLEDARLAFTFSFPELSKFLGIPRFNKRAAKFFMKFVEETVSYRESNEVRRNDFLQILIDLKNCIDSEDLTNGSHQKDGKNLTMEEIAAQAVLFFIAGFDTSSSAISFCMYELARNAIIQQKLRDEVNRVIAEHQGKLTYDGITEMKYMQQVVEETLRKYPSLPLLNRQCIKNYEIPESNIVLEEGTQVIIPLLGLHYDPEYFPDPEKFDPERFSPENKNQRHPFSYLPFGGGPRNCIGMRFGLMQVKTGLAMLLKDHKYSLNPMTSVPLELGLGLMCSAKGGIWLNVTKIS